jgi:hypothetical protein
MDGCEFVSKIYGTSDEMHSRYQDETHIPHPRWPRQSLVSWSHRTSKKFRGHNDYFPTTHKLQVLKKGIFGPFKNYLAQGMDLWMTNHPGVRITNCSLAPVMKDTFLGAVQLIVWDKGPEELKSLRCVLACLLRTFLNHPNRSSETNMLESNKQTEMVQ